MQNPNDPLCYQCARIKNLVPRTPSAVCEGTCSMCERKRQVRASSDYIPPTVTSVLDDFLD